MISLLDLLLPYQKKVVTDSSSVKVLNFSRQVGKSFCAAYLATQKACTKDGSLVIYLSTGQRAADEALKTCLKFAQAVEEMSDGKITYTSNASCLTYSNGSRIMSLPGNPASCRGWTADLLVCDEMAFWAQPEECWQAITPTLANRMRGEDKQLVICSTPLGKNSLFFELCQRARTEPGWRYFEVSIHDAIRDGLQADIDELRKMMPDPSRFATEFECSFADSSSELVPIGLIQTYCEDEEYEDVFIGADWARTSDGTAICALGRTKEGKFRLFDVQVLRDTEYARQIQAARLFYEKYKPKAFYGDAGGLGSPIMEELNRTVSARIKGIQFSQQSKTEAYERFRKTVFERSFSVKEEFRTLLVQDLSLIRQVLSENGRTSYVAGRANGSHADLVSALVLAIKAAYDNPIQARLPVSFSRPSAFGQTGMSRF